MIEDESQLVLEPNVAGLHWSQPLPADFPDTPLLNIVQLNLRPGSGGVQDNGNQPAARLWHASLDYVRSISGCTACYWAPLKEDPETLAILLQWEDRHAWKRFQESVGFGLMRGLLTRNCFNRSARLALPDIYQQVGYELELVSFQFKADALIERKQQFEKEWGELCRSANGDPDIICGGWVERDGPFNPQLPSQVALSESQPVYFLGLLFWGSGSLGGAKHSDSLRQKAAALTQVPDISKSTLTASLRREWKANPEASQVSAPIRSMSSLLSIHVPRKHRNDNRFDAGLDRIASQSLHDIDANKRLYPGPYGVYIPMGSLSQDPGPQQHSRHRRGVFDLLWLKITVEGGPDMWQEREQKTISLLPAKICMGRNAGRPDHVALLIFWESREKRSRHLDEMSHLVEQFASASNCVIERSPERLLCGDRPGRLTRDMYTEIVTFYIPVNFSERSMVQLTKDLFETAYYYFDRTTSHPIGGRIPTYACGLPGGGWDDEPISRGGVSMLRYTCVIGWDSKAASEEWLQDFARGAIESYERLGHIIDRFQLLTADVESLCLSLEHFF